MNAHPEAADVNISLNQDEARVLFEWLATFNGTVALSDRKRTTPRIVRPGDGRRTPLHQHDPVFRRTGRPQERSVRQPNRKISCTVMMSTLNATVPATVRTWGYAACRQEREIGSRSLAVQLRTYTGTGVGSRALAIPARRVPKSSLPRCLKELQTAAHNIEVCIGGIRPAADTGFASVQAD